MNRKARIAIALVLAVGVIAYTRLRDAGDHATPARTAAPAAAGQASDTLELRPTRTYGQLAFVPCTLAAPLGTTTVAAHCGRSCGT